MTTLQELITRGRFLMSDAPARLAVFEAVDGRRSAAEIASFLNRKVTNVYRDLATLRDAGLVQNKFDDGGDSRSPERSVYEKVPLARTIASRYFKKAVGKRPSSGRIASPSDRGGKRANKTLTGLAAPDESEILAIARNGEDQLHEFKAQGTDIAKISREIGAMANTSSGGLVLYGIDDEGNIEGTDITRQRFDQPLQNSVKNLISPAITITLDSVRVIGSEVLVIGVPPWNGQHVYQWNEKILIRKGTNAFGAKPEEVRQMHRGVPVI
jgi:Putative DNA-binding domain